MVDIFLIVALILFIVAAAVTYARTGKISWTDLGLAAFVASTLVVAL